MSSRDGKQEPEQAEGEEDVGDAEADKGDCEEVNDEDNSSASPSIDDCALRTFSREEVEVAANMAQMLEQALSPAAPLPRKAGCLLPRLPFAPDKWDDHDQLSFAAMSSRRTNSASVADKTANHVKDRWLNDDVEPTRTACTVFCAWVVKALQGKLDNCPLTGLPLLVSATCPCRHPQAASLAAHEVHALPVDTGFDAGWPTSLAQYHSERVNFSVESWFGNKWKKTWRLSGLAATLARRTDRSLRQEALFDSDFSL